jgi:hypothetical protein
MSVTFTIVGAPAHCSTPYECDGCWDQELNLASANARVLLGALNLDDEDLMGSARVRDLVPALERIANAKKADPGVPSSVQGRFYDCGRAEGYLQLRATELLKICQKAGDLGVIAWA